MAYRKHGAGGGFTIHQDLENAGVAAKKSKTMDGLPPATKRIALGAISNNGNRIQPFRTAKLQNTENISSYKLGEGFVAERAQASSDRHILNAGQTFPPLKDVYFKENCHPMEDVFVDESSQGESFDISEESPEMEDSDIESCSQQDLSPMNLDISIDFHSLTDRTPFFTKMIVNVHEYSREIYSHLLATEMRLYPKPGYMDKQPDITMPMRSILVDWLVEVAEEYKLHRQTFCISVTFIDRFLSQMSVLRGKLQLLGAAAMFLAAKYEEIYPPEIQEFVYITDDTYNKKQILKMEQLILKVLAYTLTCPTINVFLETYLRALGEQEDDCLFNLAMYLMELSLVFSEPFLPFTPSQIAAAALYVANVTLKNDPWPKVLEEVSSYRVEHFQECIEAIHDMYLVSSVQPQQAVQEKYKQLKFKQVANIEAPKTIL